MKRCGRLLKEVKRRSAHLLRGGLQPRAGGRRVPAARRKPPCRDPRARVAGAVSAVPIAARAVVVASVPGQAAASRPCPPPRLPAAAPRPRPGLGSGFLGSGWSLTGCGGGLGRFFFFFKRLINVNFQSCRWIPWHPHRQSFIWGQCKGDMDPPLLEVWAGRGPRFRGTSFDYGSGRSFGNSRQIGHFTWSLGSVGRGLVIGLSMLMLFLRF